jgi:hypothetical protein
MRACVRRACVCIYRHIHELDREARRGKHGASLPRCEAAPKRMGRPPAGKPGLCRHAYVPQGLAIQQHPSRSKAPTLKAPALQGAAGGAVRRNSHPGRRCGPARGAPFFAN